MSNEPVVPCPMKPGIHLWIWPGGKSEGWKTAKAQRDRVLALGAAGVIPQAGLSAAQWLEGKDPGDDLPRVEVFQQAGLQVTCGFGMDGTAATPQAISREILRALAMPGVLVMGDEEKQEWETAAGNATAQQIDDFVFGKISDAFLRCVFCPWWKPEVHDRAPDHVFWKLFRHLFCQDYGAKGEGAKDDATLDMLAHSRAAYPKRGIPAEYVHLAFQLYAHSVVNAGRIVFSGETVMAGWDIEEASRIVLDVLRVRAFLVKNEYPATRDGLKSFQRDHGITPDGDVGYVETIPMVRRLGGF